MQGQLIEQSRLVYAIPAGNYGGATGGDWASLAYFRRCQVTILQDVAVGTFGATPLIYLQQATDAAGSGAKDLDFDVVYISHFQGGPQDDETVTAHAVEDGQFNLTEGAADIYQIEIHAQDLDVNNGFAFVRVVADPETNGGDIPTVTYLLYDPAYAGKPDTLPSPLA